MRDAAGWDERYGEREMVWSAEPNRWVEQELEVAAPGRAIDLAAGEGRNAIWLAGRGWDVTAVDFSAVGLEKGQRLAAAEAVRISWVVADVLEYEPECAYDLVLIAYLHLPAALRQRVLARAASALAPNGLLLIVGHALENLAEGVGGPQDPDVLYDAGAVTAELEKIGLRVESVQQPTRPVDGSEHDAIDFVLRARGSGTR